jgi:hypothetical protein
VSLPRFYLPWHETLWVLHLSTEESEGRRSHKDIFPKFGQIHDLWAFANDKTPLANPFDPWFERQSLSAAAPHAPTRAELLPRTRAGNRSVARALVPIMAAPSHAHPSPHCLVTCSTKTHREQEHRRRHCCQGSVTVNRCTRIHATPTRAHPIHLSSLEHSRTPTRALPHQKPEFTLARARVIPVSVDPRPHPSLVKYPWGNVSPSSEKLFH